METKKQIINKILFLYAIRLFRWDFDTHLRSVTRARKTSICRYAHRHTYTLRIYVCFLFVCKYLRHREEEKKNALFMWRLKFKIKISATESIQFKFLDFIVLFLLYKFLNAFALIDVLIAAIVSVFLLFLCYQNRSIVAFRSWKNVPISTMSVSNSAKSMSNCLKTNSIRTTQIYCKMPLPSLLPPLRATHQVYINYGL